MRVLHIVPSVEALSPETMLARLHADDTVRHNETAVLSLQPPGVMGEVLRDQGIRLFSLRMTRAWQAPLAMLRLARIANAFAPDILHGWMHQGSLTAALARSIMTRPVSLIWNLRPALSSEAEPAFQSQRWQSLGAAMSGRPDAIVYNSRTVARHHTASGYNIERSQLIPDGFDTGLYRPRTGARERLCASFGIDPKAVVVGNVAPHLPKNDQAMLIEAVARARTMGQDIHLLMTGSGFEAPGQDLLALAARLLPAERLTIAGPRDDVPEWLPGLDMLAVASAWGEDSPHPIGEALASGVPVVATDLGDCEEIVGPCGRIVQPRDPVSFGEALFGIAALGAEQRQQMGIAARQRVIERFSLSTALDRYRDLHQRLHGDSRFLGRPAGQYEALAGGTRQ